MYGTQFSVAVTDQREMLLTKIKVLWWQAQGLSYTASGYGKRIPSRYMVRFNNRWHRVYVTIYSNIGTAYIVSKGVRIVVQRGEN